MNRSHSLQADVPGQHNIQLLCLITFPGTIKLPPSIAHASEGKIRFTFTAPTHLSWCLGHAFTAKGNTYSTSTPQRPSKLKQEPVCRPLPIRPRDAGEDCSARKGARKVPCVGTCSRKQVPVSQEVTFGLQNHYAPNTCQRPLETIH